MRLGADEKLKRAEQKRKEEEERRKAELEQRMKAREERSRKAQQGQQAHGGVKPASTAAVGAGGISKAHLRPAAVGAKDADKGAHHKPAAAATNSVGPTAQATPRRTQAGTSSHSVPEPKTVLPPSKNPTLVPCTPAEAAAEARNVHALVTSPYVNPGVHRTPGTLARSGMKSALASYEISPYK